MTHEHGYIIYKAGRGFYRPNACGYTLHTADAGRYSLQDAISHTHPNGPDGPRDGMTYKHESEYADGTSCEKDLQIEELRRTVAMLKRGQEEIGKELADARALIDTLQAENNGLKYAIDTTARARI